MTGIALGVFALLLWVMISFGLVTRAEDRISPPAKATYWEIILIGAATANSTMAPTLVAIVDGELWIENHSPFRRLGWRRGFGTSFRGPLSAIQSTVRWRSFGRDVVSMTLSTPDGVRCLDLRLRDADGFIHTSGTTTT